MSKDKKVFYLPNYIIEGIYDIDFNPAPYPSVANLPFIVTSLDNLIEETVPNPENPSIPVKTGLYKFPITNINLLKVIAKHTVDYFIALKQDSGYLHSTGITYSSTERSRGMLMGKLQEINITGVTSEIGYPDINGNVIMHTDTEIKAVGTGMATFIESKLINGSALKNSIDNPVVSSIQELESVLFSGIQTI